MKLPGGQIIHAAGLCVMPDVIGCGAGRPPVSISVVILLEPGTVQNTKRILSAPDPFALAASLG
ncbi:MAG: hypothetical protein Kow0063_14070 [Anaerolineae bacterium]